MITQQQSDFIMNKVFEHFGESAKPLSPEDIRHAAFVQKILNKCTPHETIGPFDSEGNEIGPCGISKEQFMKMEPW